MSNILKKNLNLKIKSNFTKEEQRTLNEIKRHDKIKVQESDRGCGFAIVIGDTAKETIEEQLGKAAKAKEPRNQLTSKAQKKLSKLRKENTFRKKKAYMEQLTIGTLPYRVSKFLSDTIKPHS